MKDKMKFAYVMQLLAHALMLQLIIAVYSGSSLTTSGSSSSWLKRKAQFYRNTTFELSDNNVRLLGGKFAHLHQTHLPFWFDFELFKWVFQKSYADPQEDLIRHHTYIKTCVRTLRARVLYRILAGTRDTLIDGGADAFYQERVPRVTTRNKSAIASEASTAATAATAEVGEIKFAVLFEPTAREGLQLETPVERAVRLVREEFNQVESRNQLDRYLMECEEVDGSAMDGKLPY